MNQTDTAEMKTQLIIKKSKVILSAVCENISTVRLFPLISQASEEYSLL
jgi:hypothetical protein